MGPDDRTGCWRRGGIVFLSTGDLAGDRSVRASSTGAACGQSAAAAAFRGRRLDQALGSSAGAAQCELAEGSWLCDRELAVHRPLRRRCRPRQNNWVHVFLAQDVAPRTTRKLDVGEEGMTTVEVMPVDALYAGED